MVGSTLGVCWWDVWFRGRLELFVRFLGMWISLILGIRFVVGLLIVEEGWLRGGALFMYFEVWIMGFFVRTMGSFQMALGLLGYEVRSGYLFCWRFGFVCIGDWSQFWDW